MQLTETQTKAIEYLAKRDARSVDQMLHMIMNEGFEKLPLNYGEEVN